MNAILTKFSERVLYLSMLSAFKSEAFDELGLSGLMAFCHHNMLGGLNRNGHYIPDSASYLAHQKKSPTLWCRVFVEMQMVPEK